MEHLKWARPEIIQRALLAVVLFVIALVGLWIGDDEHRWHPGVAAIGTAIALAVLWVLDPFFQSVLEFSDDEDEKAVPDGDVA